MKKICDCKDFEVQAKKFNEAQILAYSHGWKFDGKIFIYCPWCGKELKTIENNMEKRNENYSILSNFE